MPSPQIIQASFWSVFLDYPTVAFMISEVNDWDRGAFEDGLRASFAQWGVNAATSIGGDTYATKLWWAK